MDIDTTDTVDNNEDQQYTDKNIETQTVMNLESHVTTVTPPCSSACADNRHESPEKDETDSGEDTDDMRRDEDDDLGFSDLCKYIEKCVARKYKVDKSEAYKSSSMMVDSLRSAKYMFSDLEDMYIGLMKHGQDTSMMITELADTLAVQKKKFPSNIPWQKLLKYAVDFFHQEPLIQKKLKPRKKDHEKKEPAKKRKSPSRSTSKESERTLNKKFAKYENLRPLSNCLLSSISNHKLPHFKTKKIVGEIIDRIVTAGYSWDRILYYHAKNQSHFTKKLIPYFFMSKDELPSTLSPNMLLDNLFDFIETSKHEVTSLMTSLPPNGSNSPPKTSLFKHHIKDKLETKLAKRKFKDDSSSDSEDSEEDMQSRRKRTRARKDSTSNSDSDDQPPPRRKLHKEETRKSSSISDNEKEDNLLRQKIKKEVIRTSTSQSEDEDEKENRKSPNRKRKVIKKDVRRNSSSQSEDEKEIQEIKGKKDVKVEPTSPVPSDASSNDFDKMMKREEMESKDKDKQKQSLLEKVNEIIKSCVRLKDEKKISGSKLEKANKIIAKAQAKKLKLLKQGSQEVDECNNIDNQEIELKCNVTEDDVQIDVETSKDIEEGEITNDEDNNEEITIEESKSDHEQKEKKKKKKRRSTKDERGSRYFDDPYLGSVNDELQAMAGRDNRMTRMSLDHPRSRSMTRSRSRSMSWSPEHSYRKKAAVAAAGGRHSHHQYRHRSRTPTSGSEVEENSEMHRWIPITPCTIQEDAEVEPMSTVMVTIKAKGEFSFKDNPGCYVRITKWTGKDNVNFMVIKPQIVRLVESSHVRVEISNPYPDKFLNIYKHDKIACMSILSAPPPSSLFSRLNCSPERYQSSDKRWFKVTTVVLHRKGSLDKISISPGKTLKVVGTVIGPLKKHIGRDVLISELDVGDPVPVNSQIARITDNEKIGINISNRGRRTLIIEKTGQAIATVSVWANVGPDVTYFTKQKQNNMETFR